jgi:hypothetical protein
MLRSRTRSLGAPEWRACGEDAAACDAAKAQVVESVKASHADGAACTGYDDAECNTLTLTFSRPAPYFHVVSSLWVTFPAKEELITAGGENWWLDAANHIGNGPFAAEPGAGRARLLHAERQLLGARAEGRALTMPSSPTAPSPSRPTRTTSSTSSAGRRGSGSRDGRSGAEPEANIYPGSCTFAVMFHQLKEPFTDQKVREAFAHALDREAWVADVLRGSGQPDADLDSAGLPWLRRRGGSLGLRS